MLFAGSIKIFKDCPVLKYRELELNVAVKEVLSADGTTVAVSMPTNNPQSYIEQVTDKASEIFSQFPMFLIVTEFIGKLL